MPMKFWRVAPFLITFVVSTPGIGQEQQSRSVYEVLGSWEMIEWHEDGEVLVPPQIEGRWSIQDGIVMWIVYMKTAQGESSQYGYGEYQIDDSKFVYGYDRVNIIEKVGENATASSYVRPMYQFLPTLDDTRLVLDDDSHEWGIVLEGDRLTWTMDGEPLRVYRRLER